MHAGDGVRGPARPGRPGCRAGGRVVQQAADAHFVVVIGALQRGDFVGDQRFELGGARQRALDAVAHRGDFAATNAFTDDVKVKRWGFHIWLGAVAAGILGGWFGIWLMPDRNRETLRLLPVLERFDGLAGGGIDRFSAKIQKDKLLPDATKLGGSS